MIDDLIE